MDNISWHGRNPPCDYTDDTQLILCYSSCRHSCFSTDPSMSFRHLAMDGSSSVETLPQQTVLLYILGDTSPCQDHVISLDNLQISSVTSLTTNCPSWLSLLNSLIHAIVSLTTSEGFVYFYPQRLRRWLFSLLSFKDWPFANNTDSSASAQLQTYKLIQNVAAQHVLNSPKFSHTTPLLCSHYWSHAAAHIKPNQTD